jgi:alpha-D-xyloside xylohydrolase
MKILKALYGREKPMDKNTALNIIKDPGNQRSITDKLFAAYCLDIYGYREVARDIYVDLLSKEAAKEFNINEKAALLFAIGEHARINRDRSLLETFKEIVKGIAEEIENWGRFSINPLGDNGDRINTSTLGMIHGGLLTINNYLKRDDISRRIREIKAFVFKNNISKGTLVNGNRGREVSIDILLAVIPFGMYSPEDLVLVEAVKEMEANLVTLQGVKRYKASIEEDSFSTTLLAWYYAEKGNYERAKVLLKQGEKLGVKDVAVAGCWLMTMSILEQKGKVGNHAIVHRPFGNYNRYEPGKDERFPKHPRQGEEVIIKALSWPIHEELKAWLNYSVNRTNTKVLKGELIKDGIEAYWQWRIGPFHSGDQVEYSISIVEEGEFKSEEFSFHIPIERSIHSVDNPIITEKGLVLKAKDFESRVCPDVLFSPLKNGALNIEIGSDYGRTVILLYENIELEDLENKITLRWGDHRLEIERNPFSYRVFEEEEIIFESARYDSIRFFENSSGEVQEISCEFKALNNERFYGFGERYNNLDQRGKEPDVYVFNQYKEQGIRTYMPVPFFISSKGYGMYINSENYIKYHMGSVERSSCSFIAETDKLSLILLPGKPAEVIKKFTDLSGKPELLPKWAFGPWMSSNNWDSDEEVRKQVELTKKHEIPSTVLVIEAWSDEATFYIFNDAVYEESSGDKFFNYDDFRFPHWGRWPDPKGLVEYLHDNSLKCILWQIPVIKYMNGLHHIQKDNDEEFFINQGFSVKNEDGSPYRMPEGWFKDSLLMDFTNPEASKWWFGKRKYLVDELKVDGFKTDGGEFVFGDNLRFSNGKTGREMRNLYPNEYVEAYYNFINKTSPEGGITFSRAGFTGAQKFPAHWAGDERSTFEAFRSSIIAGLNAGISGIPFWGWDLGGFSGEIPTAELFIRGTEMAAFCPIMQYHAESKAEFNQDRTPWNIAERTGDERVLSCYRYYANLRMNLLPYIYNEGLKCSMTGLPLMKALFIEYPEDSNCENIKDQYMFGENMLVAPVVYEGEEGRELYLPEGNWIGMWDNQAYEGGKYIYFNCPLDRIPVFIKDNSIIPYNLNVNMEFGVGMSTRVDCYEKLTFRIYGTGDRDYSFTDDLGNKLQFSIRKGVIRITGECDLDDIYLLMDNNNRMAVETEIRSAVHKVW